MLEASAGVDLRILALAQIASVHVFSEADLWMLTGTLQPTVDCPSAAHQLLKSQASSDLSRHLIAVCSRYQIRDNLGQTMGLICIMWMRLMRTVFETSQSLTVWMKIG